MQKFVALAIGFLAASSAATAQRPGSPTWTLVEDLRIGEDQGPKSFNDVRSVVATKNGNIFVLDFKTQEIRLFDPAGDFVKLVARDGAGPGEIRNANGLAVGDNDIVWANDQANGRFNLYRADGSFLKQVLALNSGYFYTWDGVIDGAGRAIDRVFVQVPGDPATGQKPRTDTRIRFVSETGKADTVASPSCRSAIPVPTPSSLQFRSGDGRRGSYRQLPFIANQQVAVTRSGTAWCTPSSEYRLWLGPVGGANREIVTLKVAPLPVTEAEHKSFADMVDSIQRNFGKLIEGDPSLAPKVKPVISDIHADAAGRVWVRLIGTPEAAPEFDVFDTNGKPVARVRGRGKVSSYITFISSSHLYTTVLDDDDVPTIVRYRIVK